MKIFAISVIKNEVDIIESNLKAASKWADKIFVYDNGSTDGTWEKVLEMQNDIITPWRQDFVPFRESCRWEIYRDYKHLASKATGGASGWMQMSFMATTRGHFLAVFPHAIISSVPKRYSFN